MNLVDLWANPVPNRVSRYVPLGLLDKVELPTICDGGGDM